LSDGKATFAHRDSAASFVTVEGGLRHTALYVLPLVYNLYASSIKIIHPTQNATIPKSIFVLLPKFKAIKSPPGLLEGAA
jgi:hypothetical protein